MQETEMHHALRQYASDGEPAMGLTADAVLAAGRRSRRTRRLAGWAGAGLAVALVGAGVVVATSGGSTGTDFAAATPCPFPPGSRPPGVIAADQPLSPQLVEWATTSVTCYLSAEVPRLLPAATYARRPGVSAGPLTGFSPGGEPPWGNRVDSMTVIRDARGAGDLSVFIGVVDQSAAAREKARCQREEAAQCTVQSGPNGETVLLSTERDPLPPGNPRNWVVQVFRGHTEINVQVSNTHQSQGADGDAPAVARPEPPLSADQAVRLALSPELYLFP